MNTNTKQKIIQVEGDALASPEKIEHQLIERFKKVHCDHHVYEECHEAVIRLASQTGTSGVVILTGPTGVGKTHLARSVYRTLKASMEEPEYPKAYAPVVGIRAVPPHASMSFDWKDFFVRLLEVVQDPLVQKKLAFQEEFQFVNDLPILSSAESMGLSLLRRNVVRAFKHRRTRVLIVDEAHHILMSKDQSHHRFVFEQLKSLTDEMGIKLVLIGNYGLIDIRDHSGQLMRRSDIVHFRRYYYPEIKDKTQFVLAIKAFQKALPLPFEFKVGSGQIDELFLRCVGCVGILRELLLSSVRLAVKDNATAISWKMLSNTFKTNLALQTILKEAQRGEFRLIDSSVEDLRNTLTEPVGGVISSNSSEASVASAKRPKPRSGRVGTRLPQRDTVGGP